MAGRGEDLIFLLRGIDRLQKGAIWAGIRDLEAVGRWYLTATRLLGKYLAEEMLLNAAAELYHNAFKRDKRLLLVLGAVLGPAALTVPEYFAAAPRFITRVVGLRFGSRLAEAEELEPGMPVYLVGELENRHDPNAVAVLSPRGAHLGYLRAPLAATLTARCKSGETFAARVVTILGLHIEVCLDHSPGKVCFVVREPVGEKTACGRDSAP